jgi:hypothetical protein
MLQLGDGIDVVLRRIRGSAVWKWIFHGLAPIVALIVSLIFFDDQKGDVVSLRHALSEFPNGFQDFTLERMTSRSGHFLNDL